MKLGFRKIWKYEIEVLQAPCTLITLSVPENSDFLTIIKDAYGVNVYFEVDDKHSKRKIERKFRAVWTGAVWEKDAYEEYVTTLTIDGLVYHFYKL